MTSRTARRLLTCVPVLACTLLLATAASAGAQEPEEPRRFCKLGRPQPSCETMLVAVFTYYPRIQRFSDIDAPYEWEVGALVNRGPRQAVGATVVLGMDGNGFRTALKGRYRRWLGRYASVDAAGGLAFAHVDQPDPASFMTDRALGLTGDVAVGFTDWASVGVRGDVFWSHLDRAPVAATYGGVRLGTRPGIILGVILLVAVSATVGGG